MVGIRVGLPTSLRRCVHGAADRLGAGVYLANPADIKTVFAGDPRIFHAGEANSVLSGMLGRSSVLVLDEDVHRDRRRLMMAPFHRDAVARQTGLITEIAAANIAAWPIGTEFSVAPRCPRSPWR